MTAASAADLTAVKPSLRQQYNQIFNRLKMTSVDFATRRDVLRDIYRELIAQPWRTHDRRTARRIVRAVRGAGPDPQQDDAAPDLADGLPPACLRLWRPGGFCPRARVAGRRDRQRGGLCPARRVGFCLRRDQRRAGDRQARTGHHPAQRRRTHRVYRRPAGRSRTARPDGRCRRPLHAARPELDPFRDEPALQPHHLRHRERADAGQRAARVRKGAYAGQDGHAAALAGFCRLGAQLPDGLSPAVGCHRSRASRAPRWRICAGTWPRTPR